MPTGRTNGCPRTIVKAFLELIQSRAETILGANTPVICDASPDSILMEFIPSRQTVIVFGGGHINVKLAPLMTMVDFMVWYLMTGWKLPARNVFLKRHRLSWLAMERLLIRWNSRLKTLALFILPTGKLFLK